MSDMEPYEITYFKESAPPRLPFGDSAGVTPGWLVIWDGKPGPAQVMKVAALTEDDGSFHIVPDGQFTECTVVDDT